MKKTTTFPQVAGISIAAGLVIGFFAGQYWGLGIGVLLFIGGIATLLEERKSQSSNNQNTTTQPKTKKPEMDAAESLGFGWFWNESNYKHNPSTNIIDQIIFQYTTTDNRSNNYTLNVFSNSKNGYLEGWCIERDSKRTFRADRVSNSQVIRTETGEMLTLKAWNDLMKKESELAKAG